MQIKSYLTQYVCSTRANLSYPEPEETEVFRARRECQECRVLRTPTWVSKAGEPVFGITKCHAGMQLYTRVFRAYGATTHAVELRVKNERLIPILIQIEEEETCED